MNAHRRLALALAVVLALLALLPGTLALSLRIALAWDGGVALFLLLTWWMVARGPSASMRLTVLRNDQGRAGVLLLVLCAVAASVAAIFFLLHGPGTGGATPRLEMVAAVLTIICSWLLAHVMFALHYAHRFYRDDPTTQENDATGGLSFPGGGAPHYSDFLYFSFVIGMTCQVSDVQVTSRAMRALVLWHGILAFAFNTIVLALSINIVAGLI